MNNSLFLKRFILNNFKVQEKISLEDIKQKLMIFFQQDTLNIKDDDLIIYLKELGFEKIEILEQSVQQNTKNDLEINVEEEVILEEELTLDAFFDDYDSEHHLKIAGDYRDNKKMLELFHGNSEFDPLVFEKLMVNNQLLVEKIANRYLFMSKGMTLEDLISEGNLGLMKAIKKFDINMENSFSTYAFVWIRQSITRAIADKSNLIRIPVHMMEKINKMNRIERELESLKNKVCVEEVCSLMETTKEKYYWMKEIQHRFLHEVSLNGKIAVENANDEIIDFIPAMNSDFIIDPSVEEIALIHEKLIIIQSELNQLPYRERQIIVLRFGLENGDPQTLEEVGKVIGVTRERIRQIEAKIIRKLRNSKNIVALKE
ncbi:RNA polymerase sigma factor RpoD/SigA [Exiguobacterium sp. SL-9]|uniref:sigma-70 family RNA polymerase sigma factor n=1 Tax=Exiguobacterium sp. SL-9 TaxID=2510963 RepID=UPI001375F356|nr:sigma-70 family RNA polymerase sigma factor [Exiguobacterium sp. SL-9]